MTIYSNILRVKQAYTIPDFIVSDYFPVINDTITLTNASFDNDSNVWTVNDGVNAPRSSTDISESVTILAEGAITQTLSTTNTVNTNSSSEIVYGLKNPSTAYYTIDVSETVCRVGDYVTITPVLSYEDPDEHTIEITITNTNTGVQYFNDTNVTGPISVLFSERAQYDVTLTATTGLETSECRQIRLVSVTPALQPREDATEITMLTTIDAYATLKSYTTNVYGSMFSPGDTIVMSLPEVVTDDQFFRLSLVNLIGTAENPIVVTIDRPDKLVQQFDSWFGILVSGCEHVVLDGRGYQNIKAGWHIKGSPDSTSGVMVGNGSSYIEVHNFEFSGAGFAGMVAKTDPKPDHPEYWRGNFSMEETTLHHSYFHDTRAEGIYWGYFNNDTKTGTNSEGEIVTYRAHEMHNSRVYRNSYIRCGWDSIQLNNATGDSVIHDNYIEDSATFGEPDQNTGMSIGLEGAVFNNTVFGCTGLGIQFSALGPLDVYNNVVSGTPEGANSLFLLSSKDTPEQNTDAVGFSNTIPVRVFNNTTIAVGNSMALGAQNVSQYHNVTFKNNAYIASTMLGGQAASTIEEWYAKESNNVELLTSKISDYKVGSILKNEFNIYPDSTLATGGALIGDQYDKRGFKNWYDSDKFVGAFAGIIRLSADVLVLSAVTINDGATLTGTRDVVVSCVFKGSPTHYMISEDPTFTDGVWELLSGVTIDYQLSSAVSSKTIYLKLKNAVVETETLSASIGYSERLQFLVNLTKSTAYDNSPLYNLYNGDGVEPIPIGFSSALLTDQYGVESSLYLTVKNSFDSYASNASDAIEYIYPLNAVKWNWTTLSEASINLNGLNSSKTYDIILYAVRLYKNDEYHLSVNGVTKIFNADQVQSTDSAAIWTGVSPIDGVINIGAASLDGSTAFLGVIDIWQN